MFIYIKYSIYHVNNGSQESLSISISGYTICFRVEYISEKECVIKLTKSVLEGEPLAVRRVRLLGGVADTLPVPEEDNNNTILSA